VAMILMEKPVGTLILLFTGPGVASWAKSMAAPEVTEDLMNVLRLKGMVR